MRALSVRQPWADQILTGHHPIEYRTVPTRILHERVYLYASKSVGRAERAEFQRMGLRPGDLPTGVLVGTVEFESCTRTSSGYEWKVANPVRLDHLLTPVGKPLPIWFHPFPEGEDPSPS